MRRCKLTSARPAHCAATAPAPREAFAHQNDSRTGHSSSCSGPSTSSLCPGGAVAGYSSHMPQYFS